MPQGTEDEELIRKMRSGDEQQVNAAARELCDRAWNMVAKIVRIGGGTDADIQMILDDAVLEVIKKVQNGTFDPAVASLTTLLYRIAKNKWLDVLKRRYRTSDRETTLQEEHSLSSHPNGNPIEEQMFNQEKRDKVVQALRQLDEPCRELFHLKYSEGITLRVIALRLDITEDAVKKRHERCKKKFRKILGRDPRIQ